MSEVPPLRLVVLLQDLEFGGTQRYAVQLLAQLDRRRFAPELWLLRAGADLLPAAQASGASIVRLSTASRVGPLALLRLAWRLWRHRPELLYTLTVVPNLWGRSFAGLLRIPVVSGYRSLLPRQGERLLHRFSGRIVANAAVLGELMTARFGVEPERIAIVPNAVDAEYFAPDETPKSPDPLIVCVARLVAEKDLPTLVAAFRRVRDAMPSARLDIVGAGPLMPPTTPGLRVVPPNTDIRPHLRCAWVFALSSASEASPNAIAEAMACGLPVVATRVGGIPELVADGVTGQLVPPRDPVALAAALSALLRDADRRERLGAAGRRHVEAALSPAAIVRRTATVLLEVAQRGTGWTATGDGGIAPEIPLPARPAAGSGDERIVERGRCRPDRSIRQVAVPTLTLFLPDAGRAAGAAAVICPGGGYAGVTIDREGYDIARWLAAHGIAGLVLKYRLPRPDITGDGPPLPWRDLAAALRLARSRAAEWNIDPARIGAIGFSAGGHMVAAAGQSDIPGLAFAAVIYPVISMDEAVTHRGSRLRLLGRHPSAAVVERYSLERQVVPGAAPAFVVHAGDDTVVPAANSIRYAAALCAAGIPHRILLYDRGGHGFGLGAAGEAVSEWPEKFVAWLASRGLLVEGT